VHQRFWKIASPLRTNLPTALPSAQYELTRVVMPADIAAALADKTHHVKFRTMLSIIARPLHKSATSTISDPAATHLPVPQAHQARR